MATNGKRDPIPESFASYEEAGEFWDNHSPSDYEDLLEDVEVEFDGHQSRFFVEVQEDAFWRARVLAKTRGQSLREMIHQLLENELVKIPA